MQLVKLVNCTPHELNIYNGTTWIKLAPSGIVPRIEEREIASGHMHLNGEESIPIVHNKDGGVVDIPAPKENTIYVCSKLVADRVQRADVMSPGQIIRDEDGRPIGCRGLSAPTLAKPYKSEAYGDGHNDRGLFNLGSHDTLDKAVDAIYECAKNGDPCWEEYWGRIKCGHVTITRYKERSL